LLSRSLAGSGVIFLLFALSGCQQSVEPTVLILHPEQASLPEAWKELPSDYPHTLLLTSDLAYLDEDSVERASAIVFYQISADKLTAQQQRVVERYVSRGGNVVMGDVSMRYQRKWPLLEKLMGQEGKADNPTHQLVKHATDGATISFGRGTMRLVPSNEISSQLKFSELLETIVVHPASFTSSNLAAYPEVDRVSQTTLVRDLNEPIEMEVLPNRDILLIERGGAIKYYDHQLDSIRTIATLNVNRTQSNGLNGLAIYPNFRKHPWVFLSYTPAEAPYQYISRFYLAADSLILPSEKIVMKIPINPREGNHASNALEFDASGNLYIGFGDYTAQPEGYAPIDERPGQAGRDAQRTAANSNSYLGKILRIHPEEDGSYSIPDGNLFPKNGAMAKPEIYVMGCRNPYRFSVDPQTNVLFFGDVGPDATLTSERGSMGYDEINVARTAGYYGWPYALAQNIPYPDFNFATSQPGALFNPSAPINDSPNNTGAVELPPATPAIMWYPRQSTYEFPYLGQGGLNIMVGPVYRSQQYPFSHERLPDYYDGKLIFYDWVRGWINAATLDENQQIVAVEPLLDSLKFPRPIDVRLGPEGALYVLSYGSHSYARSEDASVTRISYPQGNRKPVAKLQASATTGATPLSVVLSGEESYDEDLGDELTYEWIIEDTPYTGAQIEHRFERVGIYPITLRVQDSQGATAEQTSEIVVGNTAPAIYIRTANNRSFYWEDDTLHYRVELEDAEDGSLADGTLDEDQVSVRWSYTATPITAGQNANVHMIASGKQLVTENGCVACHATDIRSLGPSYAEVAQRYARDANAVDRLSEIIIQGGSGQWNMNRQMPAHPFIEKDAAETMVNYILSLTKPQTTQQPVGVAGALAFDQHREAGGKYELNVSYQDGGGAVQVPIRRSQQLTFVSARLSPASADQWSGVVLRNSGQALIRETPAHLTFRQLDLSGITSVSMELSSPVAGRVEVRLDGPEGELIGQASLPAAPTPQTIDVSIGNLPGFHDVCFVFHGQTLASQPPPPTFFEIESFFFSRESSERETVSRR
jgi:cytochrome c